MDLPEGAPTINDIHPQMWARLVVGITEANALAQQSTSNNERRVVTVKQLQRIEGFLLSVELESLTLRNLRQALEDVSEGHEHPLFKPHRTSRPKESSRFRAVKGCSAGFMDFLMKSGKTKSEAAKQVADVLAKTNFRLTRGGKKASAKTVAAWRDRCMGRSTDPAREDFDWMVRMLVPSSESATASQARGRREPLRFFETLIKYQNLT